MPGHEVGRQLRERESFCRLLLVAAASAALAVVVAGCDTKSFSDPDSFVVHFENDFGRPVVLALCRSDHSAKCEHPYYRNGIAVGETYPENISPGVRTEWAVESDEGRLLRCVVLYWKHYPGHAQLVALSRAPVWGWPCTRSSPTSDYEPG